MISILPPDLSPHIAILLLACSVATSLITAALGAGGGLLLLVLMALWLPPAAIIPVHGIIQLGSNAGRAGLTWRHVDWRVIAAFAPGVALGAFAGALVLVELSPWVWQLTIALFVLYLCWGPKLPAMALGRGGILLASTFTSFISLFVGATGPLVAAFIKQLHRDRHKTVATFAMSMCLQHLPKALVFGLAGFAFREWLVFLVAMIACGFLGTWLGLRVLDRLGNLTFHRVFNVLLTLLALRLLWLVWQQLSVA
ncbi:Uncharacterized membrane protein YfcA [Marinobacter daqiaonensis]|uniref:Probable membrane transporter protein n=1 Tax=Marinobacter daqiaonensis TaxID=650891 RepID=A0A1I6IJQ9_9GAMM|nr:sulfite exporter TauE/SafE family protein [Marinobacter daqiaonensis]SFR66943.1 Uncharacterized membrane protein YfcA [Marinobacter daqiaonensis]